MKYPFMRHAMPLLLLGLPLLASAAPALDSGKNRYDCQVTTVNDLQGWVGVFSDTMQGAVARAGRAKDAITRMEIREPIKEVVQCVEWPNGKFTDAGFQTWVNEVMPK